VELTTSNIELDFSCKQNLPLELFQNCVSLCWLDINVKKILEIEYNLLCEIESTKNVILLGAFRKTL